MNDVAIIGDTGLVGSNLKKYLKTEFNYNSQNIDLFSCNKSLFKEKDIKRVVFLAGDPRMYYYADKPGLCLRNNYEIIKEILKNKIEHFIFLSTVCVYSELNNYSLIDKTGWNETSKYYGISKLLAEYEIKSKLDNYCILRLSTPFGPDMKKGPLFDIFANNNSYVDLKSAYSFIHLDDVSKAIIHVLKKNLIGCYNLTANSSIQLKELIKDHSSVDIISTEHITYDSDNVKLRKTGWEPSINVKKWVLNIL